MKKCSIHQCERDHYSKGYCKLHYTRNKRGTDMLKKLREKEQHGMSRTRTYTSWIRMIQRCYNPNETGYKNWGGRGITICDAWKNSFEAFLADMGERPAGTSLDRIDNNGNYEPSNCKWSTRKEQNLNKRMQSNNKSGYPGITWNKRAKKWQSMYCGKYLGLFKTIEDALEARAQMMG